MLNKYLNLYVEVKHNIIEGKIFFERINKTDVIQQ